MSSNNLPGTIWDNNGYWHWRVQLPGTPQRKNYPLCMPGSRKAMSSTRDIELAEASAWRLWEASARTEEAKRLRPQDYLTVNDLCDRYIDHCQEYYKRNDGSSTSVARGVNSHLRMFRELYGGEYVSDLVHRDMLRLRDALIASGIARRTINERFNTIRQMLSWGLDEDLIPAIAKAELSQVQNLKKGRSKAKETVPVTCANEECVNAVIASSVRSFGDMIKVNILTGMRPAEICSMRWEDIEEREEFWIYRPEHHKNEWREHPRVIIIGPRAIGILNDQRRFRTRYCFSPETAKEEYYEMIRESRKTKVPPSQMDRSVPSPTRTPGECWTTDSYRRSITRKCEQLRIPRWSPNQLRHNCATKVRRVYGIDCARAVLGHFIGLPITDRYSFESAEDELIMIASKAIIALG